MPEVSETCIIAVDLYKYRAQIQHTSPSLTTDTTATTTTSTDKMVVTEDKHHFLSVDPAPPAKDNRTLDQLSHDLMNTQLSLFERYRAMFKLRNINTDLSALALCQGLSDESALFRHEIAYVLGQMEKPVTVPALSRVLMDTSEHRMVRHECAESLGAIG